MRIRPVEGLTLRIALLAGFGLTFGLWLLTGYLVTQRLSGAQREGAAVNARYMASQELLSLVRAQVLLASVYVRDALLEPSPSATADYRRQVEDIYASAARALEEYVPVLDSVVVNERVMRLQSEVAALARESRAVLSGGGDIWPEDPRTLLSRVTPGREAAVGISEEVQSINRNMFIARGEADDAAQAHLQRQAWSAFGVALVLSAAIGWIAFRYSVSLEARVQQQREREQKISADLQRLSARLVDVQEEERRRIARELHDEVGQALTAVQLELALAKQRLQAVPGSTHLLRDAETMTNGALRTVRDLSQLLHPSALDDLGLTAALGSYVNGFGKRRSIRAELVDEGLPGRLVPDVERAVYRIVQEALTNVGRHAQATWCRVRLSCQGTGLSVVVEDDGVGFDADSAERPGRRRGLGLLGMRERIAQLGGSIRIVSRPGGGGTRIEIELRDVLVNSADAGVEDGDGAEREATDVEVEVTHG